MAAAAQNRWGDQLDDQWGADEELPETQVIGPDKSGNKYVIDYRINDKGEKEKITQSFRVVTKKNKVKKSVADRKTWEKFGKAANDRPGVDPATTVVADEISMSFQNKKKEDAAEGGKGPVGVQGKTSAEVAGKPSQMVVCRICKGNHWTLKCPFKDSDMAKVMEQEETERQRKTMEDRIKEETAEAEAKGKYVPPSQRAGFQGTAESQRRQQDNATIRISNLSEDTREPDLLELCRTFGPVARIYLAKDKVTGQSKGFAFVNYVRKDDAVKALEHLHGFGYDHLILSVEWAKPTESR
eukprot:Clim_evm13s144 gene=Clim_evmTU13s144